LKVCVIGSGSWGTALAIALANNGHEIDLWGRNKDHLKEMKISGENTKYLKGIKLPQNIKIEENIERAVNDKEVIVLSIASQGVRGILKEIKKYINKNVIIVNTAKGIERGTLLRLSEVAKEELPENKYVVFSGPSHAEEVSKGMPTTIVASSINRAAAEMIQDIFMSSGMRVYTNPDVIGVELGGALKNIIALGAGISDGLGYGDNAKAALMTRGIVEISRLGVEMGASLDTFSGLSGIGDLIVTCTSMHSRNRRCGLLLGEGKTTKEAIEEIGMVVEGIVTTDAVYNLAKNHKIEMPITDQLYNILYNDANVKEAVLNLMTRQKKHETEEIVGTAENSWE